ncbi:hypothetical protein AC792_00365 [Arthrobacter sp. RIT-PI-e]|nr:hypothetical protein AC792_00365 [Arthrobacter sp. RIT-PI-e]
MVMLGVSGCSLVAEQQTRDIKAVSDGIENQVGPIELRNLIVIADDEGIDGRMVGTLANSSDEDVDLTISAGSTTTDITVDAGGEFRFEEESAEDGTFEGIDSIPGSVLNVDFAVEGEDSTVSIPVLDGTLQEYRDFVPGGYTPRPSEPAATSEAEEGE